jgi:hypothetical protein
LQIANDLLQHYQNTDETFVDQPRVPGFGLLKNYTQYRLAPSLREQLTELDDISEQDSDRGS